MSDAMAVMDESSRATARDEIAALDARLANAIRDQPIYCFANDWGGDPTSKHHVMRTLARHTDVAWVESSGMRRPNLASLGDLRRIGKKLTGRRGGGPVETPERLDVVSPLAVPLPGSRLAEAANRRIYARALARSAERRPGPHRLPLHWVYTPTVEPYLDAIPGAGLVYHCVDRWWEFSEYDEDLMRRHHVHLCLKADVVFASSEGLVYDCDHFSDNVHLIRHGVDWEHFSRAALEELPLPEDMKGLGEGPVIGFFGLIHDWIDQELIGAVADAMPEATVVLIGKTRVDTGALAARPNVRLLGQKPYAELPAYAARFDVGLVPFVINQLTEAVNPIKLREYLSAGMPVVSTPLPELRVYEQDPRVWIADGHGFVDAVKQAAHGSGGRAERMAAARSMSAESWVGRTAEMIRLWRETP